MDKVLLAVDDSADDNELLAAALKEADGGCRLSAVTSVDEAVAYLQGDRRARPLPRLILLDIQIPGRDGFSFLEWLRGRPEEWRNLPVIMLTTSHNYAEIKRAYDLGANSFLVKPTSFEELVKMTSSLLSYWFAYNKGSLRPDA